MTTLYSHSASQFDQPRVGAIASIFRQPHYLRHNSRRQEHLASLGLDLFNKSVLEVGAGIGDHTTFFLDRDCHVLSVEPRTDNCQLFAESMQSLSAAGYPHSLRCRLVCGDAASLHQLGNETFDIIYCYGLLYHLTDPELALRAMAVRCRDLLLLETCASFGTTEVVTYVPEDLNDPSQSVSGSGCRPTRLWIFNRLKALLPHVYLPRTQPAHEEFPLDWTTARSSTFLTRAIFIASHRSLKNSLLLDYLPEHQTWF